MTQIKQKPRLPAGFSANLVIVMLKYYEFEDTN